MDRAAAEVDPRARRPVGPIETAHERPWATVLRVPLADGVAWFKACAPVQAFEPRLTASSSRAGPDRVAEVLGHDEERAWLLLADAGHADRRARQPAGGLAAPPCRATPSSSVARRRMHDEHLAHGVPDLRRRDAAGALRGSATARPAARAATRSTGCAASPHACRAVRRPRRARRAGDVQHDDLHMANVYTTQGDGCGCWTGATRRSRTRLRRSSSRSASSRSPTDCRPATRGSRGCATPIWSRGDPACRHFALAMRTGAFARAFAWRRQRDYLPEEARPEFDKGFASCCDARSHGVSRKGSQGSCAGVT